MAHGVLKRHPLIQTSKRGLRIARDTRRLVRIRRNQILASTPNLSKQRVLPDVSVAINMRDREPEGDSDKLEEEDEWQLYASAGYASSELESEEMESEEDGSEEIWFDGDDLEFEGSTVNWDSPPVPLPWE